MEDCWYLVISCCPVLVLHIITHTALSLNITCTFVLKYCRITSETGCHRRIWEYYMLIRSCNVSSVFVLSIRIQWRLVYYPKLYVRLLYLVLVSLWNVWQYKFELCLLSCSLIFCPDEFVCLVVQLFGNEVQPESWSIRNVKLQLLHPRFNEAIWIWKSFSLWQLIFVFMSSLKHLTSRKGYIHFQVLKRLFRDYRTSITCP